MAQVYESTVQDGSFCRISNTGDVGAKLTDDGSYIAAVFALAGFLMFMLAIFVGPRGPWD